ncbi:MAG: hypothetical protein QOE79_1301 [Sphingomonadales bacterium]|jgi:hypothetical protein|nr:hypothetical protein [Sphingomonadales bacterium]MEA3048900.1 hypothetical protein [Sphingomonadales bacterium]
MRLAWISAAAGTALLAGGFAFTAAMAAGDDDTKTRTESRTEQVIVMTDRKGGEGDSADDPHVRTFVMDHAANCTGAKDEVNESSSDGREKTHIVLCGNGDVSPAVRAERLQHALARIEANDSISAEHKEKVVAALRDAIARLQTQN